MHREGAGVGLPQPVVVRSALSLVVSARVVKLLEAGAQELREVRAHALPSGEGVELRLKLILHMLSLRGK